MEKAPASMSNVRHETGAKTDRPYGGGFSKEEKMKLIDALGNATVLVIGVGIAVIIWNYALRLWGLW
jgi:hypothetical protein